jgi:hypothetical protein
MNMSKVNILGSKIVADLRIQNDSQDNLSLEEEEKEEKIDWNGLCSDELPTEMKAILDSLGKDESFNQEIETLITTLKSDNITELFARILAIIKSRLPKISKEDRLRLNRILKHRGDAISRHLKELGAYILITHAKDLGTNKKTMFNRTTGIFSDLNAEARKNLAGLIKRFVVYEMYKILSPEQIAGETRRENFVNNMIVGGLDRALHYAGGAREVAHYSKASLKELQQRHQAASRAGGIDL